jgi:hypothetical protein
VVFFVLNDEIDGRSASGGRQQRLRRDKGGLERARLVAAQSDEIVDAVGLRLRLEGGELARLVLARRHQEVPAAPMPDAIIAAEVIEAGSSVNPESRFAQPGGVIDARVNDLAVARADPDADPVLAFDDDHFAAGARQLAHDGEADDAGADDKTVDSLPCLPTSLERKMRKADISGGDRAPSTPTNRPRGRGRTARDIKDAAAIASRRSRGDPFKMAAGALHAPTIGETAGQAPRSTGEQGLVAPKAAREMAMWAQIATRFLDGVWAKRPQAGRGQRDGFAPAAFTPSVDVEARFQELLAVSKPRRVLEAGTLQALPGRSTHSRARFPDVLDEDYVKMDIQSGPDVDIVADLHAMPEPWSGRFDAFIANAVFEHLERPWVAAKEVFRVLAPGGAFLVVTHQSFPLHGYPNDFFRFSRDALRLIFEDAGLAVEASEYRSRCIIVPPDDLLPAAAVRSWNETFPSFILVAACGRKPR